MSGYLKSYRAIQVLLLKSILVALVSLMVCIVLGYFTGLSLFTFSLTLFLIGLSVWTYGVFMCMIGFKMAEKYIKKEEESK